MSKVAEFSRYVGLVVLISAAILLAPRATVAAWAGLTGWIRSRCEDVVAWRPGTMPAEPRTVPVDIRIPARLGRAHPDAELLEHAATGSPREALRELWGLSREVVESGAVALAVGGVLLRWSGGLVEVLPEIAVFTGDLLLVLATFLVMQRVIRHYPAELLPSVRSPRRARASRLPAVAAPSPSGRLDHAVTLVLQAVVLFVALAWPSELGRELARVFGPGSGSGTTVVVAWACELPWLLVVCGFLAWRADRPLSATVATVVPLPRPRRTAEHLELAA
jgi:hypothetical protein